MRTLFIAVSKVFGLVQAYTGLFYITTLLPLIQMIRQTSSTQDADLTATTAFGSIYSLAAASLLGTIVLTFSMAWLLIFRSEWLADKLKIQKQDDHPPLSGEAILGAGARLLGLFIIVQATPELLKAVAEPFSSVNWSHGFDKMLIGDCLQNLSRCIWTTIIPATLKLFLGLFLSFKTQKVLNLMDHKKKQTEPVK
jgi:hypothetical protein